MRLGELGWGHSSLAMKSRQSEKLEMVKTTSNPRKINTIGKYLWIKAGNKLSTFHGNILSLSEKNSKSFRGLLFV